MSADDRLAAEVRRALRSQADDLPVADVPFDPAATSLLDLDAADDGAAGRREGVDRRWPRAAVAAAAVLVVLGGLVAVRLADEPPVEQASPSTDGASTSTSTSVPGAVPDGGPGLLPAVVPDDLVAWSVRWGIERIEQPPLAQLFATGDGEGRVLVIVQPADDRPIDGDLEVRGHPAMAESGAGASSTVAWEEDGALFTAEHIGIDQDAVIAFLDGLERRTDAPAGGLGAPSAGPLGLVDEVEGGPVRVRTTTVAYRDRADAVAPGEGRQLTVQASTPVVRRTLTIAGLRARYLAGGAASAGAGAVAVAVDEDAGTATSVDGDGLLVEVDAHGTALDGDVLEEVARRVEEVSATAMVDLRTEVDERIISELPVTRRIEMDHFYGEPKAAVELREDGDARATCLFLKGGAHACTGVGVDLDPVSALLQGSWYVAAIGPARIEVVDDEGRPVSFRRQEDEGWHAAEATVHESMDLVVVDGVPLRRPSV
ncbi:MAG TPA: hypothetical protein VK507_14810 [Iamia sp.]|nr:hypothetical protein [Iamia sp.]